MASSAPAPLASERGFASIQAAREQEHAGRQTTSVKDIERIHQRLADVFKTGRTKQYEWRAAQLRGLRRLVLENSEAIHSALEADLGRPKVEGFIAEVSAVVAELDHTLKHLKGWMEPEKVPTPLLQQPGRSAVVREPKGVVLFVGAWNFPINLSLVPLATGIAAGNCCVLKPSEVSPQSEQLLKELLPKYVDPEAIAVVTGGVQEATALLQQRWDHIMYTGNGAVARIFARAAAENLTPCTLELGGKSPTIVLPGANIPVAARRILNGKCFNAGQICIAPDYALVHEDVEEALVREMRQVLDEWYGKDAAQSSSYGRIVNDGHFRRIKKLVESSDGKVHMWGSMDEATRFIPPTLIMGPSADSDIMHEEIFGPVLPILKSANVDEIIAHINAQEKPLAMYIFGKESDADKVIARTSSGGVCVNDTIFHIANPELPFGGVGGSGMGKYHGKWGFDEFSHQRAVMYRKTWVDVKQRYPPYTDSSLKLLEFVSLGPTVAPEVKRAVQAVGAAVGIGLAAMLVHSCL